MKKRGERGIGGLYLDFKFILLFFSSFPSWRNFPSGICFEFQVFKKRRSKSCPRSECFFSVLDIVFWFSPRDKNTADKVA